MAEQKAPVDELDLDAELEAASEKDTGDDDLLADFNDLLDTEDADEARADDEPEVDLQELESFLDDFNREEGEPEAAAGLSEDTTEPESGAEDADAPALADDELDIAFESPQEADTFEELDLDAVAESGSVPAPEQRTAGDAVSEPPAPAAPAAESLPPVAAPEPAAAAGGGDKRGLIAAVLAVVGLVAAGGAGYLAYELDGKVTALQQQVAQVQARAASAGGGAAAGQAEQALRETQKLGARLSELAIILEGPMSHLRETNERDIRNLVARLDALEGAIDGIQRERVAAPPKPSAAAAAAPEPKGQWAVNLVSLSDRRSAQQEQAQLKSRGIETQLDPATVDGQTWYRLRVTGFVSKEAAEGYVAKVRGKPGLGGAWVSHD